MNAVVSTLATLASRDPRSLLRDIQAARREGDYRLIWYAVAAIVLFALGATILLGAIIYCDLKGQRFGAVRQKNWYTYWIGCF